MYKTSFVYLLNYCLFVLLVYACSDKNNSSENKQIISEHTNPAKPLAPTNKSSVSDNKNIEIIPLKYRSAKKLLAVISPHLVPGGEITYEDNRLIISSTDENLLMLKVLIAELDIPKKQLRLSIDTNFALRNTRNDNNSQYFTSDKDTSRQTSWINTSKRNEIQHLLISEEQSAAISIEKSRAIASVGWPPTVFNQQALKVFKITPVLSQHSVKLQISILNTYEGKKTNIDTTVTGKLNQWIVINKPSDTSSLASKQNTMVQTRRRTKQLIGIKVEIVQ